MTADAAKCFEGIREARRLAERDPLIWVSLEGVGQSRKLPEHSRSLEETATTSSAAELFALARPVWSELADGRIMPPASLSERGPLSALSVHSICLCVKEGGAGVPTEFEVHRVGNAAARVAETAWTLDQRFELADDPFFGGLQNEVAELFETCEPVSFEKTLGEDGSEPSHICGILMPFGEARPEMILAVISAPNDLPTETGEQILDLDEADILAEAGANDMRANSTSATRVDHVDHDFAPGQEDDIMLQVVEKNSVADLISEACNSAEEAREAEARSRAALYAALSRSYDLALRAAASPEEFAAQIVFGSGCSESQLAEYVAILEQARERNVMAGGLAGFLTDDEEGSAALGEADRLPSRRAVK